MSGQRRKIRIAECGREINRLVTEVSGWLCRRRELDPLKKYHTQLNVLGSVLRQGMAGLRRELNELKTETSLPTVYRESRVLDRRLLKLQSLFEYYREKFDQRDSEATRKVLEAADEIVWSCYADAFEAARLERRTTPLPYIEPHYSPMATTRTMKPHHLRSEFLNKLVPELPIPLVCLPTTCMENPWWLVFLGHEVGHHVQFDLLPKEKLVEEFGKLLGRTVCKGNEPALGNDAERWEGWGIEVFADVYSVLTMGPWGCWALGELVLGEPEAMVAGGHHYPPAVVRMALMAAVADELGIDGTTGLRGVDPASVVAQHRHDVSAAYSKRTTDDLERVSGLAKAVLQESMDGLASLRGLDLFRVSEFEPGGDVEYWAKGFLERGPLAPEQSRRAARLAVSGAVRAWDQLTLIAEGDAWNDTREKLVNNVLSTVAQCAEQTTRAAPDPVETDLRSLGGRVVDLLHETSDEEFGA